jgi:HSP20 family protein
MDLVKWQRAAPKDLWDAFDSLRGEMDRALDLYRSPDVAGLLDRSMAPAAAPAIDVIETNDGYIVRADLPGVAKDDLEVTVKGSLLSIKGDKREEKEQEKRKFFRKENWVGSFQRTIDLPAAIDTGAVVAELKDGILTVRIAKREEAKTKIVSVSVK